MGAYCFILRNKSIRDKRESGDGFLSSSRKTIRKCDDSLAAVLRTHSTVSHAKSNGPL